MKKLRMVEVEWVDSCSLSGWRDVEEHREHNGIAKCATVGYLLRSNRKEVTVVQSWNDNEGAHSSMSIPRCAVKKIRYLEEHDPHRHQG